MADKNQKKAKRERRKAHTASKTLNYTQSMKKKSKKAAKDGRRSKSGPHLPSSFLRELGLEKPIPNQSDREEGEEEIEDLYEYEEALPEEETKKNRRFDLVENYEYELPDDFKDEDVPSDDDEHVHSDEDEGLADEEGDDEDAGKKHVRMLQSITGLPAEAFEDKQKKVATLSGVQGDFGGQQITIKDLLDPLHGKAGYSKLRKRLHQLEKAPMAIQAPLPKVEKDKLERKVTYEKSRKEITKWEPLVKRNREAPTLYFGEDIDLGMHTVGTIAAEYKPRTEFEKKMAALIGDPAVMEAHRKDGARLLELNKVTIEDVMDHQNRLAKMRSLLFRHEMKAKHIKNIKSKTYHRILKKERRKAGSAEANVDPEAAKELAIKQEFKRAEERMTLKHKNSSKWAKRILKRGFKAQDEGTRTAIAEQLQQHALLTRKMNSMNENSSSDETSDDDSNELLPCSDSEGVSKLLNKAKEKTIKAMEEEDEIPKSGVFALPFMERSLKKQKEAAHEEARLALQEYELSLGKLEGDAADQSTDKRSGRRVFVGAKSQPMMLSTRESENHNDSDSEAEFEVREEENKHKVESGPQDALIGSALVPDDAETGQETIYKAFDDIIKNPGLKTTYEVAIFASNTWKKMGGQNTGDNITEKSAVADNLVFPSQNLVEADDNSDSDSDLEMVDGFLSAHPKSDDYKLPSQDELKHRAFAGDDVEMEFEKEKINVLNEENPEPEKPVLLPGWGQWTHVQQKKGIPSIITEEHEKAKRKREESLKKRKDSHLKHVIISEKIDKKAEKLLAKTLPFPYTSNEAYEQSIRMPIGPDYNPAISIGALNRPAVVKRAGVIINPIKYEDIDPFGKSEGSKEPKQSKQKKPNSKKTKLTGRKVSK
ncbi:uncharacterized protein C57A7.06 [Phalaenopsis equestris]|uniref:uncharacterized protein C57A7.06 n=1 Tax=Phalaenopsis equestris TaxID=78828 RepID=UPI0009E611DD|nr:uncharacterized protein C57A7.06 [Phalaenopsis equestris]